MAARHIARLRAQQEALSRDASDPAEQSGSDFSPVAGKKSPFNVFDLLNEDEVLKPQGPSRASARLIGYVFLRFLSTIRWTITSRQWPSFPYSC